MTSKQYKKLRKSLGTQQEVAELLGITRQLIGLRESREARITKEAELAIRSLSLT
jgi:DNA-binding XRE family transcriptional regulator